ncbi:MAG: Gfo/Idh/MocA family oxidoreductase [Candidatus Pedobacter colombiensis]|uniref:Gfo/Idh/MocA family oxidoreductase n=1 Tax=Candidatus Pedobacter colombiensis TaxID=3121371 RepID=A0AAJ6B693_9SPHI|nr:Gfo/Idh/MocA family oxidoreductase [Pedobacter sp.]WEK19667.1 MAG: Gfo/Idh/MocA family oxidoreductase [Pedobacter sp.]
MIKIALIGYGYWGPNLLRNFSNLNNCEVKMVADSRIERLQLISKSHPNVECVTDAHDVLTSPGIDAVIIATPVFTHYAIAKKALENGKHVLIEKPMTASVSEAQELIDLAARWNLLIMVDHTFLYTGAVRKLKDLVTSQGLGKIKYLDSTRINLGLFQPDINVLWDLAPHDISILNFLIDEKPISVNATGVTHTNNGIENIAYLTLNYSSGFIAHFNCSWSSPVKVRLMLIGGDEKMVVYNDLEPTEKIKIYDTGYEHKTDEDKNRIMVDYRSGDIFVPKLSTTEALQNMALDFVAAIEKNGTPISNFNIGLDVVKILEASDKSLKNGGKEILI